MVRQIKKHFFDVCVPLAKYSSNENSQVVAFKAQWPGDLLPKPCKSFARVCFSTFSQVSKIIMQADE